MSSITTISSSSPRSQQTPQQPDRVHVLGLGSIGTFTAHSASEIPNGPSITLLLHRRSLLGSYRRNGNRILVETAEGEHISLTGYDFETFHDCHWYRTLATAAETESDQAVRTTTEPIENLIVCVKATKTVDALRPLRPRLTSQSNVLFLQNGSGMIEEVNARLFTEPRTRPSYLIGVISHGASSREEEKNTMPDSCLPLLLPTTTKTITTFSKPSPYPPVSTPYYTYTSILQLQLEKLAVNAFCNLLCALNAKNGFVLTLPEEEEEEEEKKKKKTNLKKEILAEISNVVLALPELKHVPGVSERFSVESLEETVDGIVRKTVNTTCSMVWNVRAGRETEVKFINGAWSRVGRAVCVETPVNDGLVDQILERTRRGGVV
ncbi:hypothetical protein VTN00DRAFT_6941 [Thermoascus crustaceus]|uniref:uncharacterized protein n=1 Tax=Thermoascus crustaceus TaxID=5088 RepID=UPI003744403A